MYSCLYSPPPRKYFAQCLALRAHLLTIRSSKQSDLPQTTPAPHSPVSLLSLSVSPCSKAGADRSFTEALPTALISSLRIMPKPNTTIAAPLHEALIECFRAATRLVRPDLRRQLVLVGGAASIAHSSRLKTEDVDVAGPPDVIIDILEAVSNGAQHFRQDPDCKIAFVARQGFRVGLDVIAYKAESCIERAPHVAESFFEGSVASRSNLLIFRAVTVVNRGSDGDVADIRWLLSRLVRVGEFLPGLSQEELENVSKAGVICLGRSERLVLVAVLNENDIAAALRLMFQSVSP